MVLSSACNVHLPPHPPAATLREFHKNRTVGHRTVPEEDFPHSPLSQDGMSHREPFVVNGRGCVANLWMVDGRDGMARDVKFM